jgi:hypothetical protein
VGAAALVAHQDSNQKWKELLINVLRNKKRTLDKRVSFYIVRHLCFI